MKSEIETLKEKIKELQSELDAERKRLGIVLQSIVDGVYLTDNHRMITFWNRGAERITGYKPEDVLGKPCSEILCHTDEKGESLCTSACPIAESMTIREPILGKDVYSLTASGIPVPVSVSCAPILGLDGKTAGAIEVFRDISEKKKLEKQKADFYSMVTHDLKSPLTVILGYAELMTESDGLKQKYRDYLKAILENGRGLNSMIMDYLAVSKIGSSKLTLDIKPRNLEKLLKRLSDDFQYLAEKKGVLLNIAYPSLPEIEFDEKMLGRALSNLISNAIKFTPQGGIVSISASLSADNVDVSFADTGPGIPDEEKDKVFEMYFRSKTTSGTEGTGLGLAITKAVAEEHGGSVIVHDGQAGGSVFKITLPIKSPHRPAK